MKHPLLDQEEVKYEALDIGGAERVSSKFVNVLSDLSDIFKLGKVVADVHAFLAHFILQQIHLVEKENEWDVCKDSIVDDRVKDVPRLLKSIDVTIFQQNLIELRGRRQEEDSGDVVETLEPFLTLSPLTSDIDEEERYVLNL